MIEKTQNSKVRIFDIEEQKKENMNKNKNRNNGNNNQKNNIELIDAKLFMNAVLIIQGGVDKNNQQSLVNIELKTGRKHQIRAQMSHIGKYAQECSFVLIFLI